MSIASANRRHAITLAGAALLLAAGPAAAHPGHEAGLFLAGVAHPLTGADHLLAMFAVGLWSALASADARQAIRAPLAFLAMLLAGALLGLAGVQLPAVEPMVLASLPVLGLMIASRVAVPHWAGPAIIGFFAVFHGLAHGAELPAAGTATLFFAGFMASTLALHLAGLLAGFGLKRRSGWAARFMGLGIALYGGSLLAGAM